MVRAKHNNEVHFVFAGDFNRVGIEEVLHSYGALQQLCKVPTRKGATQQVDEGAKGKDGDHQSIILAPKASAQFVVREEKSKQGPCPNLRLTSSVQSLLATDGRMF